MLEYQATKKRIIWQKKAVICSNPASEANTLLKAKQYRESTDGYQPEMGSIHQLERKGQSLYTDFVQDPADSTST
jgi:hypothetical protein